MFQYGENLASVTENKKMGNYKLKCFLKEQNKFNNIFQYLDSVIQGCHDIKVRNDPGMTKIRGRQLTMQV